MSRVYRHQKSPFWYLEYYIDGRKVRCSSGTKVKSEAQKLLRDKLRTLETDDGPQLTYQEAVVHFFERDDIKPNTKRFYQENARVWHRYLEGEEQLSPQDLLLTELSPALIERFVRHRQRKGLSDNKIRGELAFMSSLFGSTKLLDGAPKTNPVAEFKAAKTVKLKPKQSERVATMEEFIAIVEACRRKMHKTILVLAVETGLRPIEMKRLTWAKVDLANRELHVVTAKRDIFRTVPLTPVSVSILTDTPRHEKIDNVIWHQRNGVPYPYTTFKNFWKYVKLRAAKQVPSVMDLRIYDLRHTFASWLVRETDASGFLLQKLLGHSDIRTTQRYTHLNTKPLHDAMERWTHHRTHQPQTGETQEKTQYDKYLETLGKKWRAGEDSNPRPPDS